MVSMPELHPYLQAMAHGIRAAHPGCSESDAVVLAVEVMFDWANGLGNVKPQTRAVSAEAIAALNA